MGADDCAKNRRAERRKRHSVGNLERVKMGILCEAVALVVSGELDRLEALKNEP